jgi:predicted Fe-Mo cluster-binding NifX family protein
MKIAVPIAGNDKIDDHFGHCESYSIYSVSDNKQITDISSLKHEQGCGCKSNIAQKLASNGVNILLAGGIGSRAIENMHNAGISVIRGCNGSADENVKKYLLGEISDNGSVCQEHHHGQGHGHGHGGQCHN